MNKQHERTRGAGGDPPPLAAALARTVLRFAAALAVVYGAILGLEWLRDDPRLAGSSGAAFADAFGYLLVAAYVLFLAIPFVPGIEIGLSLMMMHGGQVAPLVYLATVAGLTLAFLAGRLVSEDALCRILSDLRMTRASSLLRASRGLSRAERLARLRAALPPFLRAFAVDYRHLLVALLVNLPGNNLIGGGGGIAMAAGTSRLFSTPAFVLTVALAVLPVPLLVWLFGPGLLGK